MNIVMPLFFVVLMSGCVGVLLEEQAVVREQDPALPTLLRLVRPPAQLSAGLSSLSYITARAATSQKSAFTAFRQIFLISKELLIVRFLPFPFLIFLGDSEEVD